MNSSKKNVLITGADGFLGTHLCRRLSQKYQVYASVLPSQVYHFKKKLGSDQFPNVTVIPGTIKNLTLYKDVLFSLNYAVHCAGTMMGSKYENYLESNYHTTQDLVQALPGNLEKLIFISSQSALGPSRALEIKLNGTATPQPISFYGKTKLMAEQEVLNSNLNSIILRPAPILGPEDKTFLEIFQTASRGKFPILGQKEKHFQFVFVDDMVAAIDVALTSPFDKKVYHIAHPQIATWDEMKSSMEEFLERRLDILYLPPALTTLYLWFFDFLELLTGKKTNKNLNKLSEMLAKYWVFDTSEFTQDTGFKYQYNLNETILFTYSWYRNHSWTHPS